MPTIIDFEDRNQNKLGLVNRCLQAIGETELPLGTIPSALPQGSDANKADMIVNDVAYLVNNMGWWYNTDFNFKLAPDNLGFITLPPTVLRLDSGRYQKYIIKGGKLYDRSTQSFIFTTPQSVNLVWAIDYSDLPTSAYEYIACRAARTFQQRVIGSPQEYQYLVAEEQEAKMNLRREHAQYQDINLLEEMVSNRWVNPYRGF